MGTRHFECRTFDLSDNSPYISSVILAPEECKKNTQERYEIVKSEPAQSPVRWTFSADETAGASKNFECCTFDHSDNSPCLFSSGFLSRNLLENSLERKQERRQKIFDFEIFCVEEYQGESGGRNSQLLPKFRVSPVMTTSIPLRIADAAKLRRYYNSRQGKNQARIFLLHKSLACLTPFFVL